MVAWGWDPQTDISQGLVEINEWTKSELYTWKSDGWSLRAFTLYPLFSMEIFAKDSCSVCVPFKDVFISGMSFLSIVWPSGHHLSPSFVVFRTLSQSRLFTYLWSLTHLWSSNNSFWTVCTLPYILQYKSSLYQERLYRGSLRKEIVCI